MRIIGSAIGRIGATPVFLPALFVLFFSLGVTDYPCAGQTVRIAAASDLQFALTDLAAQYEKQSGGKLAISYGSSGNFFAQLQNGAPFDLFFSADLAYPQKLIEAGLAESESLYLYAQGRIVLWVPGGSPFDPAKNQWGVLMDSRVQKIAIANADHAPYGCAAVTALQRAKIYERVKTKLVFGENISQAAQFVQSGGAQAGIIALSLAVSPAMKDGKRWEIPGELYSSLDQGVVMLKSSSQQAAARAFLAYLRSEEARATIARYGFSVPNRTQRAERQP
jgi:molybdate transport system substrate-binding protein